MLIARVWHGLTGEARADEYLQHINRIGIPTYRATLGNQGAFVFRRIHNGIAEFLVVSFWDSFDAIRRFTGSGDVDNAVYHRDDRRLLTFLEPKVAHFELVAADLASTLCEHNPFEGTS
jgi:heme-degrading monooxygenase HmoA